MAITLESVHPVLMSRDVAASIVFYAQLGFTPSFQAPPERPLYAAVTRDNVTLHLQWHAVDQWACSHDRPVYRFVVSDVDALFEAFLAAGAVRSDDQVSSPWVRPGDTPWGTREFHLRDPDGNGLQFYRRILRDSKARTRKIAGRRDPAFRR